MVLGFTVLIPKDSEESIGGLNGNAMIFNGNGVFAYNYNNSEMLRIERNGSTNYIGNESNNFILNTGTGAIISNSMHSSPNYYNTQSITYNNVQAVHMK